MTIFFITTNRHKVKEAQEVLNGYNISIEQLVLEYEENHDSDIEEIARDAAKKLADKLEKTVIVEDTGVYFAAYQNFPGALPKYVFNSIGYKGIFKLLEKEDRSAYFRSVIGYCEPGKNPLTFDGVMTGKITEKVVNKEKDCLPYERIFIPEEYEVTTSEISITEKNAISHRGKAFRKLGEFLTK